MPLRRFFLNTRIFGPRDSPSTMPTTWALATNGAPASISPPSFSTKQHLVDGDFLADLGLERSTVTTEPGVTLT